jgi:hypothetical protein
VAAFLVLAVLLALFTPIADPARIGVSSQMARLEKGKTKAPISISAICALKAAAMAAPRWKNSSSAAPARTPRIAARSRRHAGAGRQGPLDAAEKRHRAGLGGGQPDGVAAGAQPASFLAQKWEAMQDNQKPDCLSSAKASATPS